MTTFISNINQAFFLPPILLDQTLVVEIKPNREKSFFIEISSQGAKLIQTPPITIDFMMEGEGSDLKEVLLNAGRLKQLIALKKVKIKGSYRNFLKLEAIITLS
jgi:SCP-2 sterol transfer family